MKKIMLLTLISILILGLAQVTSAKFTVEGATFRVTIDVDDDKVKPGETFNVEVDVENNNNFDIEDINVEVIVEDIDDGDELDDDDDIDDLDAGDDDNIDFDFDVPYAVDDDDYDIIIIVSGDNADNNSKYEDIFNATVEVEKDKHELIMKQPTVDLETLKCTRTTQMSVVLWNIGEKDEDIDLILSNSELGISRRQSFDLDEGDDEDDIKTRRNFVLDLEDAKPKTYTFFVKAEYDDGDEQETETFNIKVEACETDEDTTITTGPVAPPPVVTTPTVPVEPVIVTPVPSEPVVTPVAVPAIIEEETFSDKYGAVLILGLAYVVVIVVGVLLVVKLMRKHH